MLAAPLDMINAKNTAKLLDILRKVAPLDHVPFKDDAPKKYGVEEGILRIDHSALKIKDADHIDCSHLKRIKKDGKRLLMLIGVSKTVKHLPAD